VAELVVPMPAIHPSKGIIAVIGAALHGFVAWFCVVVVRDCWIAGPVAVLAFLTAGTAVFEMDLRLSTSLRRWQQRDWWLFPLGVLWRGSEVFIGVFISSSLVICFHRFPNLVWAVIALVLHCLLICGMVFCFSKKDRRVVMHFCVGALLCVANVAWSVDLPGYASKAGSISCGVRVLRVMLFTIFVVVGLVHYSKDGAVNRDVSAAFASCFVAFILWAAISRLFLHPKATADLYELVASGNSGELLCRLNRQRDAEQRRKAINGGHVPGELNCVQLAAALGMDGILKDLILRRGDVTLRSEEGQSALHLACAAGSKACVQVVVEALLVSGRLDCLNAMDAGGRTPVGEAAACRSQECVLLLLNAKARLGSCADTVPAHLRSIETGSAIVRSASSLIQVDEQMMNQRVTGSTSSLCSYVNRGDSWVAPDVASLLFAAGTTEYIAKRVLERLGQRWTVPPSSQAASFLMAEFPREARCRLSGGAHSEVFRARLPERQVQDVENRACVVKLVSESSCVQTLEHERRVLECVRHPFIVRYFGFVTDAPFGGFVMEFCAGGSLHDYVVRIGSLQEHTAQRFTAQTAHGLAYLHWMRIVMWDLHPGNICLDKAGPGGCCKLIDFGLARCLGWQTPSAATVRNEGYTAPEGRCDFPADSYSLGMCMFFMLTSQPPRESGTREGRNGLSESANSFFEAATQRHVEYRPKVRLLLDEPWLAGCPFDQVAPEGWAAAF